MKNICFYLLVIFLGFHSLTAQWEKCNGPFGGDILSIAISGNNMYATTDSYLFISSDNGNTWRKSTNISLYNSTVTSVIAKGKIIIVGWAGGIKYSYDNGDSWNQIRYDYINCLAYNDKYIFAGNLGYGVVRSSDEGDSWYRVLSSERVNSLCITGGDIYAGTDKGVFISTNNGTDWNAISNGINDMDILCLAVRGNTIYAGTKKNGIYFSANKGQTWENINNNLSILQINSIALIDNNIFTATNDGVFISSNNGTAWKIINNGLPYKKINILANNDSSLYAGSAGGGIFLSKNHGINWETASFGLEVLCIYDLVEFDHRIFAGTDQGIYYSLDNGINWIMSNNGIADVPVNSLIIKDNIIFAGTFYKGVFCSLDTGRNWQESNNGINLTNRFSSFLDLFISGNNIIYSNMLGIFYSSNNGESWIESTSAPNIGRAYSIVECDGNIYTTSDIGYCYSSDNGISWKWNIKIILPGGYSFLAKNGHNIYISSTSGLILLSSDCGSVWTKKFEDSDIDITELALIDSNIFAGTDIGILFSSDNGLNWKLLNGGFNFISSKVIASVNIIGSTVFTSTAYGGFYKTDLSKLIVGISDAKSENSIFDISPNPAADFIEITFKGEVTSPLQSEVRIYDFLGEIQSTSFCSADTPASGGQVRIDVSGLAPGIYFIRIGERVEKFVKLSN